jgi:dolichyl-phosphate beta-glucosyltransferase
MTRKFSRSRKELLMVVPCYNESSRFDAQYWENVILHSPEIQWVFVNDGSRDKTNQSIDSLKPFGAITIHLDRNVGKAEAIRSGIIRLKSHYSSVIAVGYVDADMAFEHREVTQFCKESIKLFGIKTNIDCYIASRVKLSGYNIHRSSGRHYCARIIATWFGFFWSNIPYDTQCGLKVFRNTPQFDASLYSAFRTRWLFDIELMMRLTIAKRKNCAILERPLNYWREIGKSKINKREKLRILNEIVYISILLFINRQKSLN